jgi:hypothetical protein
MVNCENETVWRVFSYLKRYPWLAAGTLRYAIAGTLMVIYRSYPLRNSINGQIAVLDAVKSFGATAEE